MSEPDGKLWTLDELRDGWQIRNTKTGELFDAGHVYILKMLADAVVDALNGDLKRPAWAKENGEG